jgi:hypothetical protein
MVTIAFHNVYIHLISYDVAGPVGIVKWHYISKCMQVMKILQNGSQVVLVKSPDACKE